ncbi:hypothetical protein MYSTI_08044 [Myxococcus stipitatus DSM 14675]|uniref:Uncharacterized protein n=1 Tax=Myxococcus stipitatus (strain DSM 14675 / JCM 12634 / Mx s8) TaxID=1278073 RepID=L7UN32_MYXSD|nr:hypothetical protein [Myxococcus stipitatus]AGC49310.1 hypothetical protein MYSTI_08044 [Myxococcus stipitatus DSM 14675]
MSRIDSSGSTAIPLDTVPDAPPSPNPSPSTPRERNEVQAYAASLFPSAPRRSSEPPASGRRGQTTLSAGELLALGGRPKARSGEVPSDAYAELRSRLTRGLADWKVSDADVRTVHAALGQLQPSDYRATLERMEREGLLKTYLAEQSPDARQSFLHQAESKGVLQRLAGTPASGPLAFPGRPDFFRDDSALPDSLRQAVESHAIAAGRSFHAAHAAYLGRYVKAVEEARNLPELRKLGAPQEAKLPDSVLGLDRRDPSREDIAARWRNSVGTPGSLNWVYQAINVKQRELLGERSAGTFALKGKAEVTHASLQLGGEGRLDSRGKVDLKAKTGMELKGGPVAVKMSRDSKGEVQSEVKLDLGILKVSQSTDGELKLAMGAGKHLGSYATLNLKEAEFGGGVFAKVEAGASKGEVRLGYDMKGLESQSAVEAVDRHHVGLFDAPPELGRGLTWDALPEARRTNYERNGWNREEWGRAQGH